MAVKDYDKKRMIIVGGGLSSAFCLQHLAQHLENMPQMAQHLIVEIVSDGPEIGKGIVWSDLSADDMHLMNHHVPKEYRIFSDEIMAKLTPRQKELIEGGEVPRVVEGMRMQEQLEKDMAKLKELGVVVKQTPNTEVEAVSKMGEQYLVETPSVDKTADYLVIATGHWQGKSKSNAHPGVFSSPWPASKLKKEIDANQPIAIMGSSLSAVDAMLTLAHNAGEFKKDEEGHTTFTPKPGMEKFKLVSYSPSGMLPTVMGNNDFRGVGGGEPPDLHAAVGPDGFVSLDKMYDVIRHDFIARKEGAYGNDPAFQAIKAVLEDDSLKVGDAIKKINDDYHALGPQKALEASLNTAKRSRATDKPLIWQEYLHGIGKAVEYYHNYMPAEDYDRFMKEVRPFYAKQAAAMVQTNAEEVLALMQAGRLEVTALGEHSSVNTATGKSGAEVRYTDAAGEHAISYDVVVKASGDDLQRLKDSTKLMKSLFNPREALAHEVLHQYKDQDVGETAYKHEQKEVPEHLRVIRKHRVNGKDIYYRSAGGIAMDQETCELIPASSHKRDEEQNLFLMGPPTKTYGPIFEGVGVMHGQAESIMETVTERLWREKMPDMAPSVGRGYDDIGAAAAAIYTGRGDPSRDAVISLVTQMGGDGMSDMDIVLPEGVHPEVLARLEKMFRQYGTKDSPPLP